MRWNEKLATLIKEIATSLWDVIIEPRLKWEKPMTPRFGKMTTLPDWNGILWEIGTKHMQFCQCRWLWSLVNVDSDLVLAICNMGSNMCWHLAKSYCAFCLLAHAALRHTVIGWLTQHNFIFSPSCRWGEQNHGVSWLLFCVCVPTGKSLGRYYRYPNLAL